MTNEQLKDLENKLWDSANALRAYGGIKASDYAVPVLGLIFLKYAENKYKQHEWKIKADHGAVQGTRMERPIEEIALEVCGFYMPDHARFDYLLSLPGDQSMAKALRAAMEGIEQYQDASFQDVLPKEAYFEIEKKKDDILPQLLKTLSDIPEDATGDIFGKIYEYFLGKFAMSEGQKGGEFFTPTSVVRFIVEVIEPYKGKIFDPACGSGGMFVQSATFINQSQKDVNDIYVCGQEYMGETVRLAKMNLLVNNLRGEITEVNSYETDAYDSYGKFDFVMANPPFNVKSVKESTVKNDQRFYEYGLPTNKGKKVDKIADANYLWISLFATSLNEKGRAGFVMPNSASDARGAQQEIRKKIVDSGIVDCMVSMPSNMFLTVTLPATLWFFDKQKVHTERKDKILFLDARNVYHQIDRAHREWTNEQQQNLAAIVRLYRGEKERYLELIQSYFQELKTALEDLNSVRFELMRTQESLKQNLKDYTKKQEKELSTAKRKKLEGATFFLRIKNFENTVGKAQDRKVDLPKLLAAVSLENNRQLELSEKVKAFLQIETTIHESFKMDNSKLSELWALADKHLKLKNDTTWGNLSRGDKQLEVALQDYTMAKEWVVYWLENITWLQERFPDAEYQDVVGLCKMADASEYAEEQDYSLNAGRYVGVEIEDDKITREEFVSMLKGKQVYLKKLNEEAKVLANEIIVNLNQIVNG
ncbi:class I SAM-dependent DNA methyltransferase [Aureispira sp. CCB-E]|uniref:type I restriction-modification system subunit M n=1 Tax=Aureispira sp. CCB-E TaxID=3051121 RepID=UPI00286902F1|nr:class I SAM-dependent DNA methyltransferase [Aureispira sp. CCB-E]WMX17128.1 class I SAM-dependent DNA methyltransferase [Aureispira sp. CCB-E]